MPEDFFHHVSSNLGSYICKFVPKKILIYQKQFYLQICKSQQNGIEIGSVVEIENEDQSGYWFATVRESKGVIIKYVKKTFILLNAYK